MTGRFEIKQLPSTTTACGSHHPMSFAGDPVRCELEPHPQHPWHWSETDQGVEVRWTDQDYRL